MQNPTRLGRDDERRDARLKRRAWLRFLLGMVQMFMAALSLVLLIKTGLNPISLAAVVVTCLLTTFSVLLFGSRSRLGNRNDSTDTDA